MLRFLRKQSDPQSDETLLEKYRSTGETGYLGLLYERYVELVYGVCLKYLQQESDAEDAVMAIFEQLVEKVRHHEIRQFRSWLYVLAKNHCLMQLRRQNRNFIVPFDPGSVQSGLIEHPIPEGPENGEEEMLKACLETLPPQQKSCIELFYWGDKSYKEIADMKQLEAGMVRSYIQNGRRNLKICVEKKKRTEQKG